MSGAVTRRVTRAGSLPPNDEEGRPRGRPSCVKTNGRPAYSSFLLLAGSPPAFGPVIVHGAVGVAPKSREPVEIDQMSRTVSLSTLPRASTVYCRPPASV